MVREMQSRARHGWQAVQGSFTTYSNKWQRVWTLRGPQDECGALSCDGAARRKTCLSQSARIRLFGRTCMLFYLRLGRIRPYSTPPDPWAPGASPGPVLRATYAALVAHEEAPARVCLKCFSSRFCIDAIDGSRSGLSGRYTSPPSMCHRARLACAYTAVATRRSRECLTKAQHPAATTPCTTGHSTPIRTSRHMPAPVEPRRAIAVASAAAPIWALSLGASPPAPPALVAHPAAPPRSAAAAGRYPLN